MRHFQIIALLGAIALGVSAHAEKEGGSLRDHDGRFRTYEGNYRVGSDSWYGSMKRYVCSFGIMSSTNTCLIMQPEYVKAARKNQYYREIAGSQNPDVSVSKYLAIEKTYAARGEPLNAASLVQFMTYLSKAPSAKCEFDRLGAGTYGLACVNGGKTSKFPGLTEKLLNDHFANYNKVQPKAEEVVAETNTETNTTGQPVPAVTTVIPDGTTTSNIAVPDVILPSSSVPADGPIAGDVNFVDVRSPSSGASKAVK